MSRSRAPRISVLVVNHNAGRHLRHCLERLHELAEEWRTTDAGLEVILVDNASTDGSTAAALDFLEAAPAAMPFRLVVSERNPGFGAGCNRAARRAAGRYLLLLNPDAWIDGRSLFRLLEALEADPRLGVAAPALRYPDGSRQFVWTPPVGVLGEAIQKFRNRFEQAGWNHGLLPFLLRPLVGTGWYTAACLLVRRSAYEQVDGFDEGYLLYFEDADLCRRLQRAGFGQCQVAGARAWHVRGAVTGAGRERRLRPSVERRYRASQLRYYELHRPAWERAVVRRCLRRRFLAIGNKDHRRVMLGLLEEPRAVGRVPGPVG